MENLYKDSVDSLNELYRQKYRGLITYTEFANEQQMILLRFSNGIKKSVHEKIEEDVQEAHLLKIESELR
jgi:hypothetical protein